MEQETSYLRMTDLRSIPSIWASNFRKLLPQLSLIKVKYKTISHFLGKNLPLRLKIGKHSQDIKV